MARTKQPAKRSPLWKATEAGPSTTSTAEAAEELFEEELLCNNYRKPSEMDAEKAHDPFVSITKLCQPTASQEAKYPNFLFARESENFVGFNSEQFSSSPDPTPSEPAGIVMVSPPGSISSARQQAEDDAVFHTPPEHHLPANFSSEDQNVVDVVDRCHRSKKARVCEAGLDDKLESMRIRDPGEEFGGETIPALDTEVIVDEIEGHEGVHDKAEVIVLDSDEEEMAALDLADETIVGKIDLVRKSCELSKDGVPKVNGDHKCKSMEDIPVNKGKGGSEMGDESGVGGSDKVAGRRIEKINEFGYVGGGDSRMRQKEEGIGKNAAETVEPKSGLLDFLDVLKVVFRDTDGGCTDDDFLETAKSRGLTFPRPRWWPAEGDGF